MSFYGQCSYAFTAFDRCETAVAVNEGDEQPRLDLSRALRHIIALAHKLIENATCPLAVYFWLLADNFLAFGQRLLNACLVFTDFGCHVLAHIRRCDFDAEFLRDSKRIDVQAILDRNFDRLANHLATLTLGQRR